MKALRRWRSPYVTHAAKVAAAATVIIMAVYVCVCAGFDVVDGHRLVAQIDTRLQQRLHEMASEPSPSASPHSYERARGGRCPGVRVECRPVGILPDPHPGAPALSASAWSPRRRPAAARLGGRNFELEAQHLGGTWIVAGQSLAQTDHVRSDLIALEAIAGPCSSWPFSSERWSSESRRPAP